jgi:allantoinase
VPDCELIIRHASVVTATGVARLDVAVDAGRVVAMGPELAGMEGGEEIEAYPFHLLPGGIDSHVHFNDPGRKDWETIACGSAALAAGGYTAYVDMPLNSRPVTVDAQSFDQKLEAATATSLVDFGLWGGLVPGKLDRLEELVERGVMGFKAFMCSSGIEDFPAADDRTLYEGMRRIARLDSILLLHAEDPGLVEALAGQALSEGRAGAMDFVRSRPPAAELRAISRALFCAEETGCRVHIVHVSTGAGVLLVAEARERGLDVSCETCPHYLFLTEEDIERLGGLAKCAPPLRQRSEVEALWRLLGEGRLPMVVSDHSPSSMKLKQGDDFFRLWGGIAGCQSTRQLLLAEALPRGLDLGLIAAVTAGNQARRFGLPDKGEISVGRDADLWLVELSAERRLRAEDLFYRNPFSAFEGHWIRGRTERTMLRGRTVFEFGRPAGEPSGRLIVPNRAG